MPPNFFGTRTTGLHPGEDVGVLDEAGGKVKVEDAPACFERAGFNLYGCGWIGCVPGETLISKGHREHAP